MPVGNAEYYLEFDALSVKRLEAMTMAAPQMAVLYQAAMNKSVNIVATRAAVNAPVLTGTLRRGIRAFTESPFLGRVGVISAVPYARRREFGFDNRTDALGRHYTQDPIDPDKRSHMFYLKRALIESQPEINVIFRTTTKLGMSAMNIA